MASTMLKYLGLRPEAEQQERPVLRGGWYGLSILVAVAVVVLGNLADVSFAWMMALAVAAGLSWGVAVFLVNRSKSER